MADDPKKLTPIFISQNPHPAVEEGQEFEKAVRAQVENILIEFRENLPSTYFSSVTGPYYTIQFQAAAEQLALFQIVAQEVYEDSDFDFTRPEFLWEILASVVFPDANREEVGLPRIEGDVSYRDFLKSMVQLILRGATSDVVKEGIELLTTATIEVIEKALTAGKEGSAWTLEDQFTFEVNVSEGGGTAFPSDPFTLQRNVELVLRALKPAHALFDYRHLFTEIVTSTLQDDMSWTLSSYYYDDNRKYCHGAKQIESYAGEVLTDRLYLRDTTLDFSSIIPGAEVRFPEGDNYSGGHPYRVEEIIALPQSEDDTPRSYTTSPSGLSGTLTVSGGDITDTGQDFSQAVEGEVLTILDGPNAGQYRLHTLLGPGGGPVGFAAGPATSVRPAYNLLRLNRRPPVSGSGQHYTVTVDRLGVRVPRVVSREDVSSQFYI